MKREEKMIATGDDWYLIIDMPLDGSIANLTGLYSQSGGPSSWVDDPSDNTRKVACFNSKGPVIYPDNDFELKQSVYYKRLKVSLDFWKINYIQGSHPNIIDSSYGLGSPGGLGIGFQITSRSTYNTGLGGNHSGKVTALSKNNIPIQKWIRWIMEWYGDVMNLKFVNLETNTTIHEQTFDLSGNYNLSTDRSKTIIRLGANNQWSDDRTSYAYIRNFKMWLHK